MQKNSFAKLRSTLCRCRVDGRSLKSPWISAAALCLEGPRKINLAHRNASMAPSIFEPPLAVGAGRKKSSPMLGAAIFANHNCIA
jgi:hypothetical protein